ncbi:regulatory protein RecX [Jiella sp. M17.18]|uniref:regulatory protein RecX n=1 Tax=Jiella sp. M17.18 TaxID=3234247 RepID=UPI0034DFF62E
MDTDKPASRPVSAEWLMRAAAHYVERYATSVENLRRVLRRKVMRRALAAGDDPGRHEALIETTLARLVDLGLVDDRSFAEGRAASLRRRGTSRSMTAAKLRQKGVDGEMINEVLAEDETDEATAAFAYARRRRLGPFRLRQRAERRDKDVAAMVRAGHAYGHAVAVIDGSGDRFGEDASGDERHIGPVEPER